MKHVCVVMTALLTSVSTGVIAAETIPGPIPATVLRVYDGDTITVSASIWPRLRVKTSVRVRGVDTPEIRGKCDVEKILAIKARDFVRKLVGGTVRLTGVKLGKYAGRVIADVWFDISPTEQKSLSSALIVQGLGRVYDGGKRTSWCDGSTL